MRSTSSSCQVAAGHDHVARQVPNPHRPADSGVHVLVGVATRGHAERCAVDETEEPVAHVKARIECEAPRIDRAEQGEEDGDLDGARGMKPAIAALRPLQSRFVVIKRHSQPLTPDFLGDCFDPGLEGG